MNTITKTGISSRHTFWLVLIAIMLLSANMRSPIVALGSIAPIIQNVLGVSEAFIGWLGAVPLIMFALGSLISPKIGRLFGIENTLIAALVGITLGIVIRSVWVSSFGFLLGTLLFSLAIGFANTLGAPIIKQRTPQHIALMTSIYSLTMTLVAGAVAGVVYPLTLRYGWQWALGGWAVLGIVAIAVWLLLRIKLGSSHRLLRRKNSNQPKTDAASDQQMDTVQVSVWRSPLAWQLAFFIGLQSLLFYTVAAFLPSIWQDKGLSLIEAGHMASIYQWMAPITVVFMTWRIKHGLTAKTIAMVASMANLIGSIGLGFLSADLAWLWSGMMGLGCAGIFTLSLLLFAVRTDNPQQASQLSGMVQAVGYLIAFFGPLGVGWLYDLQQSWQLPLSILVLLMAVNVGVGWLVGRPVMLDGRLASSRYADD